MSGSNSPPQPQQHDARYLSATAPGSDVYISQQSKITAAPFPENHDLQIARSANETQPDVRSSPTKTLRHPIIPQRQNNSTPRLQNGNFAEPVPFRSMDTLNEVELHQRGAIFAWYSVGTVMDDMATLVAAAAFGHYGVADRLISEKKVNPDPYVAAVGLETKEEFSTPILAAIGGPNQRVIRLLLSNESFDPTRGFRGKSYAAIAIQRRGPHWQKESHLLWFVAIGQYSVRESSSLSSTTTLTSASVEQQMLLVEKMQQVPVYLRECAVMQDTNCYTFRCPFGTCTQLRRFPHPESFNFHIWNKHGVESWQQD
jgi:hypothetical protein